MNQCWPKHDFISHLCEQRCTSLAGVVNVRDVVLFLWGVLHIQLICVREKKCVSVCVGVSVVKYPSCPASAVFKIHLCFYRMQKSAFMRICVWRMLSILYGFILISERWRYICQNGCEDTIYCRWLPFRMRPQAGREEPLSPRGCFREYDGGRSSTHSCGTEELGERGRGGGLTRRKLAQGTAAGLGRKGQEMPRLWAKTWVRRSRKQMGGSPEESPSHSSLGQTGHLKAAQPLSGWGVCACMCVCVCVCGWVGGCVCEGCSSSPVLFVGLLSAS